MVIKSIWSGRYCQELKVCFFWWAFFPGCGGLVGFFFNIILFALILKERKVRKCNFFPVCKDLAGFWCQKNKLLLVLSWEPENFKYFGKCSKASDFP